MTAEIVSIFDHPKLNKPKLTADELLQRWMVIAIYGSEAEILEARTAYTNALIGAWPTASDKPCDSEPE